MATAVNVINLAQKLSSFSEYWSPHIVAELNGQMVKVVKFQGEFVWHHHEREDELFLVISGTMHMELRDTTLVLQPGEMVVIPRGVEHRPVAPEECEVLLFEPASTRNTGNITGARTIEPENLKRA